MKSIYLLISVIFISYCLPVYSQTISGTVYEIKKVTPASRSIIVSVNEAISVKKNLTGVDFRLVYGYDRMSNEKPKDYWECEGKTDEKGNFTIKPKVKLKEGARYSIFGKKEGYVNLFFSFKYEKKMRLDSLKAVMVPLLKSKVIDE